MYLGSKLHWSWQFLGEREEEIDGKTVAVAHCEFCTQRHRDSATKMTKHLIEQCRKIGQEARKSINMLAGIKQKTDEPPSKYRSSRIKEDTISLAEGSPNDNSGPLKDVPFAGRRLLVNILNADLACVGIRKQP
uniref:BED-type domain-containing protein n=1 Tax=Ditylenchus dipsaci TaxID=166011 RepID=A0A915DY47_9BILA